MKNTLDITFDYGVLESIIYKDKENNQETDILTKISDELVEEFETLFWEKNPISFAKLFPHKLREEIDTTGMFNCLDMFVKEGGTKYSFRYRGKKLI